MLSKTLYQYLGTDKIMKGVYDWLYKEDSGILGAMDIVKVADNGVKYNVESVDPTGSWIDVGDVVPEDTGTIVQRSAALYRFIGDADVDKMRIDMDATQSIEAVEIMRKTRGMLRSFHNAMIWGQTTTASGTKQPKGLARLCAELESEATVDLDGVANSQVIWQHATSSALTVAGLEQMMDAVKLGCNALIMSRAARRALSALVAAAGTPFVQEKDKYEHNIAVYNGAKIYINDHIKNNIQDADGGNYILTVGSYDQTTTWTSGYDNTIIIGAHLSPDGVCCIETPGGHFQKEAPFTVPNKDAFRHRFKWYGGFACFNKYALSILINVATTTSS